MAGYDRGIKQNVGNGTMMDTRGASWLIILVLLLFVVIAAGLLVFFNVGGIRDTVMGFLFSSKAGSNQQSEESLKLQQELKALEDEKNRLKDFENQLNTLKSQLESRQQELEQRELKLQEREKEIDELQQKLSAQFENIKDIAKLYENMEGEQAASILSEMSDNQLVIQILKNMSEEKSAEILGLMDAKKAADLTRQMAGQ